MATKNKPTAMIMTKFTFVVRRRGFISGIPVLSLSMDMRCADPRQRRRFQR